MGWGVIFTETCKNYFYIPQSFLLLDTISIINVLVVHTLTLETKVSTVKGTQIIVFWHRYNRYNRYNRYKRLKVKNYILKPYDKSKILITTVARLYYRQVATNTTEFYNVETDVTSVQLKGKQQYYQW